MTDEPTDEQLVSAFAKGDSLALGTLARRYESPLYGLARGLLSGKDDLARDAVQEVWVRVIRYAKHFEGRSSVRTWLYRIVVNNCHDLRDANAKESRAILNGSIRSDGHERPPSLAPNEDLARLLEGMPESVRLILLLCHHRGLTHEQAADVLGIPVGTLKSRLHAAMTQLRAIAAQEAHP